MKKLMFILFCLLITSPAVAVVIDSLGEDYDRVVSYFQSEAEIEVMDAAWESKELLRLGVFKHDEDYNAYASQACDTVREQGLATADQIKIQVIDLKQLGEKEEWVVLGQANCAGK